MNSIMHPPRYFETRDRYYKIVLMQDLLDDWVLFTCWGGKSNGLGGYKTFLLQSPEDGIILTEKIATLRLKRGYFEIFHVKLENLTSNPKNKSKNIQLKSLKPKIEKPSFSKKSDALDPKKYIQMLTRIQHLMPQVFAPGNTPSHNVNQEISARFPEYSPQEIKALWKQWKATPFFVGLAPH